MCKHKPGPRCHYTYLRKLYASARQVKSSKRILRRLKRKGATPSTIARQETRLAEALQNHHHRTREYYSSPYARLKLVRDELPKAKENLRHKEAAVIRAEDRLANLKEQAKTNKGERLANEIAAAERKLADAQLKYDTASGEYARRARQVQLGAERWEAAKANLEIQKNRDSALEHGEYAAAFYTEDDLDNAAAWETVELVSRPDDQNHPKAVLVRDPETNAPAGRYVHKSQRSRGARLVRTLNVETPTFEQYRGHVEVRVAEDRLNGGYRVVANAHQGTISIPKSESHNRGLDLDDPNRVGRRALRKVGRSALPGYEHRPRTQRPDIDQDHHALKEDQFDPTRSQKNPNGIVFKTREDAGRAAAQWANGDGPTKFFARAARAQAVRQAMYEDGYKTRAAQDAKLAEQRRTLEATGAWRFVTSH